MSTEDNNPIYRQDETAAAAYELAYTAFQSWGAEVKQPVETTAAARQYLSDNLEAQRTAAAALLDNMIATLPPGSRERESLEKYRAGVDGADKSTLRNILNNAKSDYAIAVTIIAARADTVAHIKDMNALHLDLYANDPEYRKATDENRKQVAEAMSEMDKQLVAGSDLAKEKGYTNKDKEAEVLALKNQVKKLEAEGKDLEAHTLRLKLLEANKALYEDYIRQAEARGDTASANVFREIKDNTIQDTRDKLIAQAEKQIDAYIKALEASPKLSKEELAIYRKTADAWREQIKENDAKEIITLTNAITANTRSLDSQNNSDREKLGGFDSPSTPKSEASQRGVAINF